MGFFLRYPTPLEILSSLRKSPQPLGNSNPCCEESMESIFSETTHCHGLSSWLCFLLGTGILVLRATASQKGSILFTYCNLRLIFVFLQDWPPTFDSFEKVFYFWTIFVFANSIWIVVPTTIILQTLSEMGEIYNPPRSSSKKRN